MTFGLWLMIGSGVFMGLMLFHRYRENSFGVATPHVVNTRIKVDPVLSTMEVKINRALSLFTRREMALVLHNFSVYMGKFFMYASYRTHKISSKIVEKASKRKEDLSRGGAASFYLKQMKEAKENGESGEIVEK